MGEEAVCLLQSTIRGHHVYKSMWTPIVGETLQVSREPSNSYDIYAVSVQKEGHTVGHVPREVSRVFSTFLLQGGNISCEVIGHRKFGKGLEVPCCYKLTGGEKIIKNAKKTLTRKKSTAKYTK